MFLKKITTLGAELGKAFGYVYLLDYTYRKSNGEKVQLVKIGTSKDPWRRFKEIQSDLKIGDIRIKSIWTVWYPENLERNVLHRMFWEKKDRPPGAGPKAGADEFFRLNPAEKLKVTVILALQSVKFATFWISFFLAPVLIYLCFSPESCIWVAKAFRSVREFFLT